MLESKEVTQPTMDAPPTSAMLRLVAHELGAHVTVLSGYSELLREKAVRDDPRRLETALDVMRSHLASLREMSSHLTAAIGAASDRLVYHPADVDLRELAQEAVTIAGGVASPRGVSIAVDTSRLGTGTVVADRFHLVTAMRNLLENALRYGPPEAVVSLRLSRHDDDVEILVHDRGAGIGELGERAFAAHRRGRLGEERAAGLGLGLNLVAEVARMHGGSVLWGRDDDGAVIGLRFPARRRHTSRG